MEEDRLSGYTDVGWTMVLCFPAIRVNNDGSALSSEQCKLANYNVAANNVS